MWCFFRIEGQVVPPLGKEFLRGVHQNRYHSYTDSYVERHVVWILCLGSSLLKFWQAHSTHHPKQMMVPIIYYFVPSSAGTSKSTGDESSPQIWRSSRQGTDPPSSCLLTCCHFKWQIFLPPLRKWKNNDLLIQQPTCLPKGQRQWWCRQQRRRRWWWWKWDKGLDGEVVVVVVA